MAAGPGRGALRVEQHGLVPYAAMLAHQEATHARVVAGAQADTLLLLEHPPVVTAGRNAQDANLLLSAAALAARGIGFCRTGRGGDVTYHGPGQLVGYPIVHLQPGERDVRAYVGALEAALIGVAADFGVAATRRPGLRGIWVGRDKLAAIGVRLAQWTTLHGFALNVDIDPADFACIVPCGLHGCGVTSLARARSGPAPAPGAVREAAVAHLAAALGRAPQRADIGGRALNIGAAAAVPAASAAPGPHLSPP